MDFINNLIQWLEANWGVTVFGTLSIGGVATTAVLLVKQWLGNIHQINKLDAMWKETKENFKAVENKYLMEKEKNKELEQKDVMNMAVQNVIMDAIIKISLSSKLDSDDKASIVANVERLKMMSPKEIVEDIKEDVGNIANNVSDEINERPEQTAVNIAAGVTNLLEKYTAKKE